jgi:hypothetical protein
MEKLYAKGPITTRGFAKDDMIRLHYGLHTIGVMGIG